MDNVNENIERPELKENQFSMQWVVTVIFDNLESERNKPVSRIAFSELMAANAEGNFPFSLEASQKVPSKEFLLSGLISLASGVRHASVMLAQNGYMSEMEASVYFLECLMKLTNSEIDSHEVKTYFNPKNKG